MALAGMKPDPWQARLLTNDFSRVILNASRQSGKSQVASALALRDAFLKPPALILLLSPSLRQSGELFRDKLLKLWYALGSPLRHKSPTQLTLELSNGSRIVSLPGEEGTIRGFSGARHIVIDESSRVPDSLYHAVRPMLAVSRGSLTAISTPFGKRGWYWECWDSKDASWEKIHVPGEQCPRITKEFLGEERVAHGERWFQQEYCGSFEETTDAVFSANDIASIRKGDIPPLFSFGT